MGLKSLCMESHAPLSRERGEVKVVSRGKSCVPQGDEAKVHLEVVYPWNKRGDGMELTLRKSLHKQVRI